MKLTLLYLMTHRDCDVVMMTIDLSGSRIRLDGFQELVKKHPRVMWETQNLQVWNMNIIYLRYKIKIFIFVCIARNEEFSLRRVILGQKKRTVSFDSSRNWFEVRFIKSFLNHVFYFILFICNFLYDSWAKLTNGFYIIL